MENLIKYLSAFVLVISFFACAKIGAPPGGPKDEEPPKIIKAKPENFSTNYSRKNVAIKFDEFIKLKNVFTEFTISPPIEDKPTPLMKGKGIVVDLPASDLDSLTYTLDFGQSIADNNEGNVLSDFKFVISKQAHIDSFSISGKVLDAFTHLPDEEGTFVYLYNNLSDTVPYTTIPNYLGRTNSSGEFNINHIAPGTYAVFTLKDANSNMLFDMPSEVIGYSEDPVYLYPDSFPAAPDTMLHMSLYDSTSGDSISADHLVETDSTSYDENTKVLSDRKKRKKSNELEVADSTMTDSLEFMVYGYSFNLYSFVEYEEQPQYLLEYDRPTDNKFNIIFNQPLDKLPKIELLSPDTIGDWYLLEKNTTLDTLVFWLPDSSFIGADSIITSVTYPKSDSLGELIPTTDTLVFDFRHKDAGKKDDESKRKGGLKLGFGKKEDADTLPKPIPRVKYKHNIKGSGHDLYVPIVLTPEVPVLEYHPDKIEVMRLKDTIEVPTRFNFVFNDTNLRKATINFDYEPKAKYILKLYEGAFYDIYGRTIDSTEIRFQTQKDDYYGIIELNMKNVISPVLLQLLDPKEKVLKQVALNSNQKVTFDFLKPGKYSAKIIHDKNENGKWDTGDYKLKIQPEEVEYLPTEVEVKSNWTIENEWILK